MINILYKSTLHDNRGDYHWHIRQGVNCRTVEEGVIYKCFNSYIITSVWAAIYQKMRRSIQTMVYNTNSRTSNFCVKSRTPTLCTNNDV